MARNIRVKNGIVVEIIPSFIENPQTYYNKEAGDIIATENEFVAVGWLYDDAAGTFSPEPMPEPEPSDTEVINALLGVTE